MKTNKKNFLLHFSLISHADIPHFSTQKRNSQVEVKKRKGKKLIKKENDDKKNSQRFEKRTGKLNLFIALFCALEWIGCFIPAILCIMRGALMSCEREMWIKEINGCLLEIYEHNWGGCGGIGVGWVRLCVNSGGLDGVVCILRQLSLNRVNWSRKFAKK